jgi:hypothetical protein
VVGSGGLIFLRRNDVREELKLPLDETLPTRTAQIAGDTPPQELARQPDPRAVAAGVVGLSAFGEISAGPQGRAARPDAASSVAPVFTNRSAPCVLA